MMRVILVLIFASFLSLTINGQSSSGFVISTGYSFGNLIGDETNPRVENMIASAKLQLDYSVVKWDHTIMRVGAGYNFLLCSNNSVGYLQAPITFQRFISSDKTGFNTSLSILPSYSFGNNRALCYNTFIVDFNIDIAVRFGTTFERLERTFEIEFEFMAPMSSIQTFGTLKYIVYGLRFSYHL